jgi:hypothetical protein
MAWMGAGTGHSTNVIGWLAYTMLSIVSNVVDVGLDGPSRVVQPAVGGDPGGSVHPSAALEPRGR